MPVTGRARRRPRAAQRVAVTGAQDALGRAAAEALAASGDWQQVVGLGPQPARLRGVDWRLASLDRAEELAAALEGVDAVVHLGLDLRPQSDPVDRRRVNVEGSRLVLAVAGSRRVVLVTSAMVYGARPDNPVPLPEDAPIRGPREDDGLVGDLVEVERVAAASGSRDLVVLRPATLTGPGVDTVFTRHFEAPRLLVVRGHEPTFQLCHVEDLARAVVLAARGAISGSANVACRGSLTQEDVETLTGRRRLEVSEALAVRTVERLRRVRVTPAHPSELDFYMHPWVVETPRLDAAGWEPAFDNAAALRQLVEQSDGRLALAGARVSRESAAVAGAGATAAVLGAAAIVRSARRRKRR